MAADAFDFAEFRKRLYAPEALRAYRAEGFLDDPTTKEFPVFRTRFSPTVGGPLHVGGALCLLMNYIWARLSGNKVWLRFESHDRCDWCIPLRDDHTFRRDADLIRTDIEWLGLAHAVEEVEPLAIRGDEHSERIYDWLSGYQPQPGADVVAQEIARMDDDHRLGVNMLVRGWDLYSQSYLYFALARRMFGRAPDFTFVPVLCDTRGEKLCKSTGAGSVRDMGLEPHALLGRLYSILVPGDPHKRLAPDETVEAFALSWRKDRRWSAEALARAGLREGPPAWKPIRPPSFHRDFGMATSVIWDPDFVDCKEPSGGSAG